MPLSLSQLIRPTEVIEGTRAGHFSAWVGVRVWLGDSAGVRVRVGLGFSVWVGVTYSLR